MKQLIEQLVAGAGGTQPCRRGDCAATRINAAPNCDGHDEGAAFALGWPRGGAKTGAPQGPRGVGPEAAAEMTAASGATREPDGGSPGSGTTTTDMVYTLPGSAK